MGSRFLNRVIEALSKAKQGGASGPLSDALANAATAGFETGLSARNIAAERRLATEYNGKVRRTGHSKKWTSAPAGLRNI